MSLVAPPTSWTDLRLRFGDERQFRNAEGRLTAKWEQAALATLKLPAPLFLAWSPETMVTRIRVHKLTVDVWAEFYEQVNDADLWTYLNPFGGGYADRAQRGSATKPSLHSWGLANDHDPNRNKMGAKSWRMPQEVVVIGEKCGLTWGGRFKSPRNDSMHWQIGKGM